jgi:hypothetical protein
MKAVIHGYCKSYINMNNCGIEFTSEEDSSKLLKIPPSQSHLVILFRVKVLEITSVHIIA